LAHGTGRGIDHSDLWSMSRSEYHLLTSMDWLEKGRIPLASTANSANAALRHWRHPPNTEDSVAAHYTSLIAVLRNCLPIAMRVASKMSLIQVKEIQLTIVSLCLSIACPPLLFLGHLTQDWRR
jgi:hypothetical protein